MLDSLSLLVILPLLLYGYAEMYKYFTVTLLIYIDIILRSFICNELIQSVLEVNKCIAVESGIYVVELSLYCILL